MLKKIITIFLRDLKVSTRGFLTLYILVTPILIAICINLLTPSVNNTTVNLAMIEGENDNQVSYMKDFAQVELFKDAKAVEARVAKRDNIIGILPDGDDYYVLKQGDEFESVVEYATMLLTFYEEDVQIANSNAKIYDFGRTKPPLKKMLVNIIIIMISVLGGMLIALNIVEEKVDKTIRAIHLSPVSRMMYIMGKSMMGVVFPIYGVFAVVLIAGYRDINYLQMLVLVVVAAIISMVVGFVQGLQNEDVISAAGNIKILFLPVAAAIVAIEILSDKWQILFYWIPFYWAYKGNDAILMGTATWAQILMYSVIVAVINAIVFMIMAPKIRKGLQ